MKYSKLSVYRIKKILKCFSDELTATQTAKSLGLHRNTIDPFFQIFRDYNYLHKLDSMLRYIIEQLSILKYEQYQTATFG